MIAAHATEPRYLVAGGALLVFVVGITAQCTHLLILSAQLEYDQPVAAIQRAVERIRLVEYRATKWAVLGGVVIWLPALLVLFEALTGVAALARVDLRWLISNLGVGLVALAAGHALSKRYVERSDLGRGRGGWSMRCRAGRFVRLRSISRSSRDWSAMTRSGPVRVCRGRWRLRPAGGRCARAQRAW